MGFPRVDHTSAGADGGVDFTDVSQGGSLVGQVKFEAVKTSRPQLQGLYGAGHALGAKDFVFVSSAGYTAQALTWADGVGMALFRFALDGSLEAVNPVAQTLLA